MKRLLSLVGTLVFVTGCSGLNSIPIGKGAVVRPSCCGDQSGQIQDGSFRLLIETGDKRRVIFGQIERSSSGLTMVGFTPYGSRGLVVRIGSEEVTYEVEGPMNLPVSPREIVLALALAYTPQQLLPQIVEDATVVNQQSPNGTRLLRLYAGDQNLAQIEKSRRGPAEVARYTNFRSGVTLTFELKGSLAGAKKS